MATEIIGVGAIDRFQRQSVQDGFRLAPGNRLQRRCNRTAKLSCAEVADLAETDHGDTRRAYACYVRKYGTAAEPGGHVATFQMPCYRTFAGRINVRRSLPQPVTLVNADDDTVDSPA